jgi:hypothetical protein
MNTRKRNRSSSHAHLPCPVCNKHLSGIKGAIAHLAEAHQVSADAARARYGLEVRRK